MEIFDRDQSRYVLTPRESLSAVFDIANDERSVREIMAQPVRSLRDAVVTGNSHQFFQTLSLVEFTKSALNQAMFFAIGFERYQFREHLLRLDLGLNEQPNGLLLRDVLKGDIHGVRFSLRKKGVNVHAYNEECFKQAIVNSYPNIAEELVRAGADVTAAANDRRFYNRVFHATNRPSPETIDYYKRAGFTMLDESYEHIPS